MLGLCILCLTGTEWPKPTCYPSKVIAGWCYGDPTWCAWPSIYLLSDSQHSAQVLIFLSVMACHSLKVIFSVPVQEINLIAYLPLVQPTETHPNLDLNPGRCSCHPLTPSRQCGSESTLAHGVTERGMQSLMFMKLSWRSLPCCWFPCLFIYICNTLQQKSKEAASVLVWVRSMPNLGLVLA